MLLLSSNREKDVQGIQTCTYKDYVYLTRRNLHTRKPQKASRCPYILLVIKIHISQSGISCLNRLLLLLYFPSQAHNKEDDEFCSIWQSLQSSGKSEPAQQNRHEKVSFISQECIMCNKTPVVDIANNSPLNLFRVELCLSI